MKTVLVRCMALPKGVPVPHLESWKETLAHFNGDELKAIDIFNKYGRQKDSLVNARDYLSEAVATIFPVKTKMKDKETVPAETESEHLDRFVDAAVAGKATMTALTVKTQDGKDVKVAAGTITGTDDKTKAASVWRWLQTIIDAHGDFPFDLKQATRVGKAKKPPVFALSAAENIVKAGSQAKWVDRFTNGWKDSLGRDHEPVAFNSFVEVAPAGATAEDKEKVRLSNLTALAWAVAADDEAVREKYTKKDYV